MSNFVYRLYEWFIVALSVGVLLVVFEPLPLALLHWAAFVLVSLFLLSLRDDPPPPDPPKDPAPRPWRPVPGSHVRLVASGEKERAVRIVTRCRR